MLRKSGTEYDHLLKTSPEYQMGVVSVMQFIDTVKNTTSD